jgi:membrane protease YdiL (CAAX protease family)
VSATAPPIEPEPPAPADRDALPPWRAWTAPASLVLGLAGAVVLGGIVFLIAAAITGEETDTPAVNITATALSDVAYVGAAVFFAQLAMRPTAAQFGLRPTRFWPAVGWAVVAYVTLLVVGGLWLLLFDVETRDPTIDDLTTTTAAIVATAVLVTVIAPIAEEVLFRGYMFTALRNRAGVWGGAALNGVLFGAIHYSPDRPAEFLVPLALFGMLLCLLYFKTRSLYPCIALHAVNNAVAFGNSESWQAWQVALLALGALAAVSLVLAPARRWGTT